MMEVVPLVVAVMAFGCVAIVVFVIGRYLNSQATVHRRLPVAASTSGAPDLAENVVPNFFLASLAEKLDEKTFGIEGSIRTKLRLDLMRAGYFSGYAIRLYILARLAVVFVLPLFTYIFVESFLDIGTYIKLAVVAASALIGVLGPDAYIKRRQRLLQQEYRLTFPDLLDMLVVCSDAGLSLTGAFARIQPEVSKQSRALGMNLALLGAEMRAGRSTADALGTFADRVNLDEARAFVILLRQSVELGTDIAETLRVYGNEMRTKRLLRAEEAANKLPVKMVIPLGVFIFPVILIVILLPVILRLLAVAGNI
jgi:tight adherence protein C